MRFFMSNWQFCFFNYLYITMRKILIVCLGLLFTTCAQSPAKQEEPREQIPQKAIVAKKEIVVAILPMQGPGNELCEVIKKQIELFYGFKTAIMEERYLPSSAYYPVRNRYRADTLLDYLIRIKPAKYDYIMGLTEKDISCTNGIYEDWGIFGFGFMPGEACVISTFRLKRNMKSQKHFEERVIKVALHELGHNIGLPHCPTKGCMMQDAEGTIKSVDEEKIEVCELCQKKIQKFRENQ